MAGTHFSGFKYSRADLFDGAPMVLVPPTFDDIRLLDRAKKTPGAGGLRPVSITTADKHDQRIAFTSQMAHVISNAYIKAPPPGGTTASPPAATRTSPGWPGSTPPCGPSFSWRTRRICSFELDTLIGNLNQYKNALEAGGLSHPLPPAGRGPQDQGGGGREMTTVTVKASSHTYDVTIGRGLLAQVGQTAAGLWKGRTAAVVSDTNVAPAIWTPSGPAWRGRASGCSPSSSPPGRRIRTAPPT